MNVSTIAVAIAASMISVSAAAQTTTAVGPGTAGSPHVKTEWKISGATIVASMSGASTAIAKAGTSAPSTLIGLSTLYTARSSAGAPARAGSVSVAPSSAAMSR